MALTTYTELKTSVADWLNRADLTAVIPDFITMAEAKFNRELRTRDMLTSLDASADAASETLPADFLQEYSLEYATPTGYVTLTPIGEAEAKEFRAGLMSGNTRYYSIFGSSLYFIPTPGTAFTYRLKYYAKIPVLSAGNATNWLLTKSPDLYLHGSLLEAAPYLKNDERLATWSALRQQEIDAMNLESERAMRSSTNLVVKRRTLG